MDKRRRKKLQSHKRGLTLVDEHRPYLTGTPGGAATVATLDQAVADESTAIVDQESNESQQWSAGALLRTLRRTFRVGAHLVDVGVHDGGTGLEATQAVLRDLGRRARDVRVLLLGGSAVQGHLAGCARCVKECEKLVARGRFNVFVHLAPHAVGHDRRSDNR